MLSDLKVADSFDLFGRLGLGSDAMARTAEVVAAIKEMILAGELAAGDRLPTEKDLGARLGVSRGPLREGVSALAAMGVLDTRQGDGTYVTSLEPGLLMASLSFVVDVHNAGRAEQFLAVRRVLECEAAALAAMNIDADNLAAAESSLAESEAAVQTPPDIERFFAADVGFHRAVAAGAGNPVLAALIASLSGRTARARRLLAAVDEGALGRTVAEHRAVLQAITAHDPERARLRMEVHLVAVEESLTVTVPGGQQASHLL
jgi:GntR family transcriptional regulator, transcriptional repressor for pyruvate dehydrogenase complex